ncbi:MAG: murein L,D-transpeptidase catalytic domain family protein [Cellvibrionales bacterium]|nr:murein L,D-transpeptidase catalytic domain family protein [Cellvibrionales bacterium]
MIMITNRRNIESKMKKKPKLAKHSASWLVILSSMVPHLSHASNKKLYEKLNLKSLNLKYEVFDYAMKGFDEINPPNKKYLAINDYSQHSSKKRFYLINLETQKVEINDYVAHGKHSGVNGHTKRFSNTENSKQTSLGFYLTDKPYYGGNGFSLKLKGLEPGINDNAMKRYIVMHGASYVSDTWVDKHGRIGRSWGCPAISQSNIKEVINKIEGGTLMLSYSDKSDYLNKSKYGHMY